MTDPPARARSDDQASIRLAVFGAAGRMGRMLCRAFAEDNRTEVVAALSPRHAGAALEEIAGVPSEVRISATPDELDPDAIDVAVDFSRACAAASNLPWCAVQGLPAVVGTTGLTSGDLRGLDRRFRSSACLVAPNFAIGAVLMMHFAELAAPFFPAAEVVDLHHDGKLDAPSGTATLMAERVAGARAVAGPPNPPRTEVLEHARGAAGAGGVRIHSVRLPGLLGHQYVVFGTEGQTLTIRHDSYDRSSFAPGVLLAVRAVRRLPAGLTVGLEQILETADLHTSGSAS